MPAPASDNASSDEADTPKMVATNWATGEEQEARLERCD